MPGIFARHFLAQTIHANATSASAKGMNLIRNESLVAKMILVCPAKTLVHFTVKRIILFPKK
jgi:hypothetical protein